MIVVFCVILDSKCVEGYRISESGWNGLGQAEGGGVRFHNKLSQPCHS